MLRRQILSPGPCLMAGSTEVNERKIPEAPSSKTMGHCPSKPPVPKFILAAPGCSSPNETSDAGKSPPDEVVPEA